MLYYIRLYLYFHEFQVKEVLLIKLLKVDNDIQSLILGLVENALILYLIFLILCILCTNLNLWSVLLETSVSVVTKENEIPYVKKEANKREKI